ncbi:hypothetical protein AK812_SmicGene31186 [Symbiodinium microadriaticum]|uniref:Uncharacterized protein n=1 Tax=Symbiodinium microadriaticum TaxID=2951 RepID=A0A1Q9CXC3_SYMMI|nr:hypothetical protein AK812_SmicGene31186 [Symbiodinium microadriaticum]
MAILLRTLVLAWLFTRVFAGWPSRKGNEDSNQSWKTRGYDQWSYRGGKGSSYHQGKGYARSSPNDALTLELLDRLARSSSVSTRDRSRRRRRHSSSRSNSRRRGSEHRYEAELRELRAYREHHEAQDKAKSEKEAKEAQLRATEAQLQELEARILKAIPSGALAAVATPAAAAPAASSSPPQDALSAKTKKLVEALLEEEITCEGLHSWDEIDRKVAGLTGNVLKTIHKNRMPDAAVPRTSAARVASITAFLKRQVPEGVSIAVARGRT